MKDTTFWPSDSQLKKLAAVHKPTADKKGLEELKETYMRKPYSDRSRGVCPGGGLFSTAKDVARFCQMVLNGGTYKGKRILSEESVKTMTSHQTGELPSSYGIGWSTEKKPDGSFGHGGAYGTDMRIDPKSGLITVYMIQHAGFAEPGGGKILETFKKAAREAFAK
jgi:CubicO group peptidase (beta-lactamase class C family)